MNGERAVAHGGPRKEPFSSESQEKSILSAVRTENLISFASGMRIVEPGEDQRTILYHFALDSCGCPGRGGLLF